MLGRALAGRRDDVVIVTKVGNVFDEQTRTGGGNDVSPAYLRRACDASLRRLGTDRIDVYLIHDGIAAPQDVPAVIDVLEELVAAGKLRWYGSSISDPAIVRAMAEGPHMVAAQHELNVLRGELEALDAAEELGLASLNRTPLAMGLLSGRYRPDALPAADDVRRNAPWWDFFDEGAMERWLERIAEGTRRADRGRAHARPGRARLDLGPQPGDAPAPGLPHRRPGAGERRRRRARAASRRAHGAHPRDPGRAAAGGRRRPHGARPFSMARKWFSNAWASAATPRWIRAPRGSTTVRPASTPLCTTVSLVGS